MTKGNGQFSFDPLSHIYTSGRRIIPSVTQTLSEVGISPDLRHVPPDIFERKRRLGVALHKALHYLLENDLDESSIDSDLAPYLKAFRQFQEDHKFTVNMVEHRMWTDLGGMPYGGTLDVTGLLDGKPFLIDFKSVSGAAHFSWSLQTAAYANGIKAPLVPPFKWLRATLQLFETGKYAFRQWDDPSDLEAFRCALALTHWKINHGEKPWIGR